MIVSFTMFFKHRLKLDGLEPQLIFSTCNVKDGTSNCDTELFSTDKKGKRLANK
jgi:hypothetical protein